MTSDDPVSDNLPELERRVFEIVQRDGPTNVAGVTETLAAEGKQLAYTTVMTMLTRIWDKGFLLRERRGRAFFYSAADSSTVADHLAGQAAIAAIARYGNHALTGLVKSLTPEQRTLLGSLLQDGDGAEERGASE